MFKHIFVPVDGSELSSRAMDASLELAMKLGARVTGFVCEPDIPLSAVNASPTTFARKIENHEARTEAQDRKSTRLNSSHSQQSRMPSSA